MRLFKREIREKKGIALIMALWIMTILLVVAASFAFMMRTEVKMAGNYRNGVKAHYLALAGVDHAIAALLNDTGNTDHYGDGWFTDFAEPLDGDTMAEMYEKVRWQAQVKSYGDGTYAVHLSDENSKLSLNYANAVGTMHLVDTLGTGTVNFQKKVCKLFDYRDGAQPIPPFSTKWGSGTMSYDTQSGYEGAGCKNNFLDTIYEIQKVTGINLGAGGVYDNPLDENSGRGSKLDMTVYSQDQNTQTDGSARIDINNTTQAALETAIGSYLSDATADCAEILDDTLYSEYCYPLYGPLASPIPIDMGVGAVAWITTDNRDLIIWEEMRDIADEIKVGTDSIIEGTVNINTATIYGLRGLYGINVTYAPAIIAYRIANGPFAHRGLIMNVTGVKREVMQQCGDIITVRSDRFRIYSTGRVTDAAGNTVAARKIEAVVDRHYHDTSPPTAGPIEVLYWSERVFED